MKDKSKIFIGIIGGILGLVVSAAFLLFYFEAHEPDSLSQNSVELSFTVGEENAPDYLKRVDHLLGTMDFDTLTIRAPSRMNVEDRDLVKVSIRFANSIETLKLSIVHEALKDGAAVKLSDKMEVHLSGDNFIISPRSPSTQETSRHQQTDWKWEIQPQENGDHELHLRVIALIEIDGQLTTRVVRTFDKTIEIIATSNN